MANAKAAGKTFTRRTMTKELADSLHAQYGSDVKAARAIQTRCVDDEGGTPSLNAVRQWIQNGRFSLIKVIDPVRERVVNQILNVIDEAGIPLEALDHDNPVTAPK